MTPSGEIVFFNDSAAKQSGFSNDEMLGKHVSRLLPESNRRKVNVIAWLKRWAEEPNPEQLRHLSLRGVRKNGDKRRYQVRVSKFEDKSDVYFAVVLRDITEEQEQTARLRHDQLVTNRIIAIGEDAVLSIDSDANICLWNQKAEELFGYTEKEILGKKLSTLIPELYRDAHPKWLQSFAMDKTPSKRMGKRGEIAGLHKSGTVLPLEASITKTYIDNKQIMSAQIRDISERKLAQQVLKDKESRFRAIFDHTVSAIALLDATGLVLEINSAARAMLPLGESIADRRLWELSWWDASDSSERREVVLKKNVSETAQGLPIRTRTELATSRGTHEIDFSLTPVTDDKEQLVYIIAEARKLIEP